MIQPLVTIVAICHNHQDYVAQTLESIRQQTYGNVECFIINNTREDDSENRIEQWVERTGYPCTVIQNQRCKTVVENCNLGLERASGEYLVLIACDDEMLPDRIALQTAEFQRRSPEYVCVYGEMNLIGAAGEPLGKFYAGRRLAEGEPLPGGNLLRENSRSCYVGAPAAMVRTEAVRRVGGYDTSYTFEDWPLFLALGRQGGLFAGLLTPLVNYRILPGSLGKEVSEKRLRELEKLFNRNRDVLVADVRSAKKWIQFARRLREFNLRGGLVMEFNVLKWAGIHYFPATLTGKIRSWGSFVNLHLRPRPVKKAK